jgi:methylmalonyl-CoA mutase
VLEVAAVAQTSVAVACRIEPLPRIRLAEPFEQLRDASDRMLARTGARPKVFLANLGKPSDSPRARALPRTSSKPAASRP